MKLLSTRKIIPVLLAMLLSGILFSVSGQGNAGKSVKQNKNSYRRPAPTKPLRPSIPEADRFQKGKVFLEQADSLFRPGGETEEVQVVKGNVKFRQGGMWLYCDSAFFYPDRNAMDAFGHVEMTQGDTLFVYADNVYYDGEARFATLSKGPSRPNVQLKDRKVTLTTDSLDYDLNQQKGWYAVGGKLQDDLNTLTSLYGEYSPETKVAEFRTDVVLVNNRDGFRMQTNELVYNTLSHIADINSETRIEGANDTILTAKGRYNTLTDHAELLSRSTVLHRDSSMNVISLEGDSIIYDKVSRISRAYMFRDPFKQQAPMVINDTARKITLIGGYGEYDDGIQRALATDYPLLIEWSRPDSIFMRADIVLTEIEPFNIDSDTLALNTKDSIAGRDEINRGNGKPMHIAKAIGNARFFTQDLQGIADTLLFVERDTMLFMIHKPVVWSEEKQIYGNRINVHFNDSTPDWAELPEHGMMAQYIDEDFYDQLTGSTMKAWMEGRSLKRLDVDGNVQVLFLPQENDSSYNKLVNAESSYLSLEMEGNRIKHLKMWPEVSGTVSPLFEVKHSAQYIPGFRWLGNLRPKREWYGNRWHWADELGDVPEELERYFREPPLFRSKQADL